MPPLPSNGALTFLKKSEKTFFFRKSKIGFHAFMRAIINLFGKNFQPDPSKSVWLVYNYIATTHVAYRLVPITTLYNQGLENIYVTFPLDLTSRSGEDFWGLRVNSIWLPNHVTDDIICVNFLFLMDSWSDSHMCKVSPRFVQPFQRKFLKFKKQTNNMAAESCDWWHH